MKKEIDLEEIFKKTFENSDCFIDYNKAGLECIHNAMREACNQCLDLAAENAETSLDKELSISHQKVYHIVDKQSILQIKDWIK